jgi:hypothetical protein
VLASLPTPVPEFDALGAQRRLVARVVVRDDEQPLAVEVGDRRGLAGHRLDRGHPMAFRRQSSGS